MSADGRAADSPQQESPQQGIQSIEADGLADALSSTAGQISAELGYRPA